MIRKSYYVIIFLITLFIAVIIYQLHLNKGLLLEADKFINANQNDEAIKILNRVIKTNCFLDHSLESDCIKAYTYSGNAFENKKAYSQALHDYDKVTKLVPDSSKGYRNKGFIYFLMNDYDNAILQYKKSIELVP